MEKLRIIVGGYIGLYPTGGATWDYIQYPLGLKMLGHDVYYIEDTMQYPIFQKNKAAWNDASYCIEYLQQIMEQYGFTDKWAYRDMVSGKCFGMNEEKLKEICASADVFINLSCSTYLRDEYLKIPKRVLIDSDPMFTQIQYSKELEGSEESQKWNTKLMLENHNYLFSFGENIGQADCIIPTFHFRWYGTRQPICFDLWNGKNQSNNHCFTSIMNWSGRKKLNYNNQEWGQKDVEFEKYIQMPEKVSDTEFKIVINPPLHGESKFDKDIIQQHKWQVLNPHDTVNTCSEYAAFIQSSLAEFSIAKETYVKSNSGWFSGRSACYLAASKPVVTQETQWTKFIDSGDGLLAFHDMESAIECVEQVKRNPAKHRKAAKELAASYFDSDLVLTRLLNQLN